MGGSGITLADAAARHCMANLLPLSCRRAAPTEQRLANHRGVAASSHPKSLESSRTSRPGGRFGLGVALVEHGWPTLRASDAACGEATAYGRNGGAHEGQHDHVRTARCSGRAGPLHAQPRAQGMDGYRRRETSTRALLPRDFSPQPGHSKRDVHSPRRYLCERARGAGRWDRYRLSMDRLPRHRRLIRGLAKLP